MSTHNSPRSSSPKSPVPSNLQTLVSGEIAISAHTASHNATPHEPEHGNTSVSYHCNSEREPQHTEGVQEYTDRPSMGPLQFSTQQKYKRWWFNPLEVLKKIFSRERRVNKRKGWL